MTDPIAKLSQQIKSSTKLFETMIDVAVDLRRDSRDDYRRTAELMIASAERISKRVDADVLMRGVLEAGDRMNRLAAAAERFGNTPAGKLARNELGRARRDKQQAERMLQRHLRTMETER